MTVLTGNVMGFMTGEWKNAPPQAVRWMHFGIVVLILAIITVGLGGAVGAGKETAAARQVADGISGLRQPATCGDGVHWKDQGIVIKMPETAWGLGTS